LVEACYKGKLSLSEISIAVLIFYSHFDLHEDKKMVLFCDLSFLAPKSPFSKGRRENKEKRLFYFAIIILLPIQIQLLDLENPKDPKMVKKILHFSIITVFVWAT
jgi:hypothetical protein